MLKDYLKAGFPALGMLTSEADRVEQLVVCEGWEWFAWDCIRGIRKATTTQIVEEVRDPVMAINWLNNHQNTVLIAHNLHLFLSIPEVIQSIANGALRWKSTGNCLIIISPVLPLVPEVEKLITVINFPLPDEQQLYSLQCELGASCNTKTNKKAARAAKGLTEFEAETAYSLSLIQKGYFSSYVVTEQKKQMIKKSGLMEFWTPADINQVGGLQNLKDYINNRAKAFEAGNETLPKPKGILLVGISGTGKSLAAKAIAHMLNWPLIKLDIGALKSSLVGSSEQKMRDATKVIDAFGSAVIWIDEAEKVFAGIKSSGETDAGVTAGMFATFLTWMQETTTPMLVIATANDVSKLPAEFMRSGRFDGVFFVDLPNLEERKEILKIMNQRYKTNIPDSYAEKTQAWSGSELEQLCKDSLFDGIDQAYNGIVPLSKSMREQIQSLRDWSKTRARLANSPEKQIAQQRKIRATKLN